MLEKSENGQLLVALREEFKTLPAGARVPTIREVAGRYGTSQFAAQRAFETLKEEGLIQSFVGRGSFVTGVDQAGHSVADARILVVSHVTPSRRGANITRDLHSALVEEGHKIIQVTYGDVGDLRDLLGRGGFDICVLQPRRSILPVEALALLKSKARHMIVEGRQLELMDVDVFARNRAKSIAIALRHLSELGHTHVGLLTERLDLAAGYGEIENLFIQMSVIPPDTQHGPIIQVDELERAANGAHTIEAALQDALQADIRMPTAFIVSGRFLADEISEGFTRAGFNIPRDVSIVHLRASETEAEADFLTTVGRSAAHVSTGLVELINWRLANPTEPAGLVLDDPTLRIGRSTQAIDRR